MANITITPTNFGTVSGGLVGTVPDSFLPAAFIVQKSNLATNLAPCIQVCSSTADAVTFANAVNIAIFTSTGPDAATLATPAASDAGKILILVNTNVTQNVVTTAANKIVDGADAGDTLTAPAANGAVTILIASTGFWNMVVGGTGSWVLTEV